MVEIRHFAEDWGGPTRDAIDAILDEQAAQAGHPFNPERLVFVAEEGGVMLGGLAATIAQGWMHVDLLAVQAPFRRRGIGRRLLAAAEALAEERGLVGVWLDTVAFQAPEFYPLLGYSVFGRLPDFPPGQERLFFLKRLDGGGAPVRVAPGTVPVEIHPAEGFADWDGLLALLHRAFAFMEGRIDPPSSLHRLDPGGLAAKARAERCFLAFRDGRLVGCVFCEPRADCLYVGKLAVDPACQGQGIGRALMARAEAEARALGLAALELQTRVELAENHRAFGRLGFAHTGETAHAGYDRPTSVTMRKALG